MIFVKIFKLNTPNANEFEFDINYPQNTGLTLDVVAEVEGNLQTNLVTHIFSADILEITPVYNDSEQKKILADDFFDDKSLRVKVDGKIIKSTIRDGIINVELNDVGSQISLEKIYFEDLGIIFIGKDSAQINFSGRNYLPWILAFIGVSIILVKTFPGKKNITLKQIMPLEFTNEKPIHDKNFFYKGELIVSVMKNPNKDYIAPRMFNLFRQDSVKPIDLTVVLKTCGINRDLQQFKTDLKEKLMWRTEFI